MGQNGNVLEEEAYENKKLKGKKRKKHSELAGGMERCQNGKGRNRRE